MFGNIIFSDRANLGDCFLLPILESSLLRGPKGGESSGDGYVDFMFIFYLINCITEPNVREFLLLDNMSSFIT